MHPSSENNHVDLEALQVTSLSGVSSEVMTLDVQIKEKAKPMTQVQS